MCVQIKKCSLRRTKINQASGSETCVYSWYTSPHGSKHRLHVVSLTLQFGIVSSGSGNSKAHEFGFIVVFHAKGSISVVVNSLCGVNALLITSGRETQYCQTTTESDSVFQITNRNLIQRCNAICTPDWAVPTYRLSLLQVDSIISSLCHFNSTGEFRLFRPLEPLGFTSRCHWRLPVQLCEVTVNTTSKIDTEAAKATYHYI